MFSPEQIGELDEMHQAYEERWEKFKENGRKTTPQNVLLSDCFEQLGDNEQDKIVSELVNKPKTEVVNLRHEAYDVYIGRAGKGQSGEFGNPHPIGFCQICQALHDRTSAIAVFKKDFLKRIEEEPEFKKRILELRNKKLGCFCKPDSCHGDVIKEWLDKNPKLS